MNDKDKNIQVSQDMSASSTNVDARTTSDDSERMAAYQKRIAEMIRDGNTDRLDRALAPRKYEKVNSYTSKEGRSTPYGKAFMDKTNSWMEANKEHFSMVMNIGMKDVLNRALAGSGEKLGPYLMRLAREDILRQVGEGKLDPDDLISTYNSSVESRRQKLLEKDPDNAYAASGFREDPLISELKKGKGRASLPQDTEKFAEAVPASEESGRSGKLEDTFIQFS